MFHFDSADYLCPSYIKKNCLQTHIFHNTPVKNDVHNQLIKILPTSA